MTSQTADRSEPRAGQIAVSVKNVDMVFGNSHAVKNASFELDEGRFLTILGPSGSGKTTLLRMIAGFQKPSSGEIVINGTPVSAAPPHKRSIGMVFQKLALFPHMTVAQNIGFPLRLRKVSAAEITARVDEMIRLMELKPEYLTRYPRALSGGEQQRVALARSMISSPKLLLLDEPLSALDVKLKKVLQAELKRLHRSVGVTFVHVTHDLEEAMMLADRICVMRAGRILQLGEPADIYYRPADAFVAGFIGETNLLPITVSHRGPQALHYDSSEIADANGTVPAALAAESAGPGPALMMVRPELIRRIGDGAPADCSIAATVTEVFTKGGTVQYRARTAAGTELAIEIQGTSHLPMQLGEHVRLGWPKKDIWVLNAGEA